MLWATNLLSRRTDEGGTWRKINLGSGSEKIRAIATSLQHPEIAYASYRELDQDGIKWMGVAKTTDAGRTWKLVWKEDSNPSAKPAANVHDAWITERFGSDWGENPLALGVADQDANLCYATDLGRTMRTTDGGANWNAMYSRKSGDTVVDDHRPGCHDFVWLPFRSFRP